MFLALLLLGVVQARAQKMVVALNDGNEIMLDEAVGSCKITFADGQMLFHVDNTVKKTFGIKDVQRIYSPRYSSVDALDAKMKIAYYPADEEVVVDAIPGTTIAVYSTDGACVMSKVQTIAAPAISVAHLSSGTYIVVVGSETLKFVKR